MISSGFFSSYQPNMFASIIHSLLDGGDKYMLLADYSSYVECQERVAVTFEDVEEWTRRSIINVANSGKFSADRTIQQYAEEIWGVKPIAIDITGTF
jgi:starch phosphorylase